MRSLISLLATVLCMAAGASRAAEPTPPRVIERTIALKGVSSRIDHLAIDLGRKRLFVAELGNGTVNVIDLASASVIRRIEGRLRAPAMDRCAFIGEHQDVWGIHAATA